MSRVRSVVRALQKLYPKELADSSWDNTGLLVDCSAHQPQLRAHPSPDDDGSAPRVLLTVDLTQSVGEEAVQDNTDLIVAYHPFIFRGLKAIGPSDPQQSSLLRLIQSGISVYCPHTAVDAQIGGVNDWLMGILTDDGANEAQCNAVVPSSPGSATGMGRVAKFKQPMRLSELVQRVKKQLSLSTVQLILADRHTSEHIETVAVCAGSGSSVLRGVDADLWLTGELGHHDMLHLRESGTSAIVCGHSNTERGFLPVLASQLAKEVPGANIKISWSDRDPIQYV